MVQPPWQDALNPQLAQRLLRPLVCPGVIPDTLAMAIFERSRQFKQRLSLLHQFQQRWNKQSNLQMPDVPIVYAQWIAPATQSAISQNPSDPNRQGAGESMRIEGEHTTSTQIVTQQSATAEPTSPTLPLVIQAKLVNPATSTVTSPLSSMPSDSKPLQSSIMEDRESALPSVNTGTGSILQHPQLPIVTPLPRSPLQEQKLNSGISSLAEEKALMVKAENQAVLPTPPQQRSPVTNQLPLARVTPLPRSPLQEQKLNSGISSLAEEKALVVKAENQAVLSTPPQQHSPVTNQLPLASVTPSPSTGSVPNTAIADSAVASSRLLEELPLVKVENTAALSASVALAHRTQPLVFARPAPTHVPSINKDLPTTASRHQSTERSPVIRNTLKTP